MRISISAFYIMKCSQFRSLLVIVFSFPHASFVNNRGLSGILLSVYFFIKYSFLAFIFGSLGRLSFQFPMHTFALYSLSIIFCCGNFIIFLVIVACLLFSKLFGVINNILFCFVGLAISLSSSLSIQKANILSGLLTEMC